MKVLYVITFLVYYSCYTKGYYVVLTSSNCLIVRLFSDAVCHRIYNKRRYIYIIALTRSCYYHLRQLRVVSRSLSSSSASTLVHAFIANRLDYCSSLYCGLPQVRLRPLNGVLRAAARMIGGVPKFGHISDCMRD